MSNLENKFFAIYADHDLILIFDTQEERDTFVYWEWAVYPDITAVGYAEIQKQIQGRTPEYDKTFDLPVIDLRAGV